MFFSLFFCFKKGRKYQSPEHGGFGSNRQCSQGKPLKNHDEPNIMIQYFSIQDIIFIFNSGSYIIFIIMDSGFSIFSHEFEAFLNGDHPMKQWIFTMVFPRFSTHIWPIVPGDRKGRRYRGGSADAQKAVSFLVS